VSEQFATGYLEEINEFIIICILNNKLPASEQGATGHLEEINYVS